MTEFDWFLVLATLAGPILAVQAQKFIERAREKHQRQLHIFYTLMGTRAERVSPDHVKALNSIDLEFYGRRIFWFHFPSRKEKTVVTAWRTYQDHLNQTFVLENATIWSVEGEKFFIDLLFQMAIALDFNFDRVQLQRGIYQPRAHNENEEAQKQMRDGLTKVLSGISPLKVEVINPGENLIKE